jgi:glutaredoxin
MQELKAEKPPESPEGSDPVLRLMAALAEEGFTTEQGPEWWDEYGETIYRRQEKLPLTTGETIFIFTRVPDVNERILRQTSDSVVHTYGARGIGQKALSVLQSTTVYHCLVVLSDTPHNENLADYITRSGGATFIPVVIVPGINEVLYPNLEDKVGVLRPRVEYLQYLLGERRETVNMHKPTIQAMWVSAAVVALLLVAVIFSFVT